MSNSSHVAVTSPVGSSGVLSQQAVAVPTTPSNSSSQIIHEHIDDSISTPTRHLQQDAGDEIQQLQPKSPLPSSMSVHSLASSSISSSRKAVLNPLLPRPPATTFGNRTDARVVLQQRQQNIMNIEQIENLETGGNDSETQKKNFIQDRKRANHNDDEGAVNSQQQSPAHDLLTESNRRTTRQRKKKRIYSPS